ncbi:GNAT family N-acetyltransferase [Roseibium sp. RKSG952]|uniref:GNAT family N-acetyltransferase n=1 Tax=Roseibium sp. RKSG952 TaxID=2529384 RepID=UPI0012BD3EA0|nr:GNAT family N-acetyltransferase [Roseibium sp. RKSG952]MTH95462.1 GNAT family N-acetyltransferase [Roseibium sp. RKSG952]
MLIRTAIESDFQELLGLYAHLIPDDLGASNSKQRATFDTLLHHPGVTILVGETGNRLVSTCTLVITPNLTRGCAPYAIIENVVTASGHRSKGLGKQLMTAAMDRAFEAGCYKIMLMTGAQNTKAQKFYERLGFRHSKAGFEIRAPGYPKRKIQ